MPTRRSSTAQTCRVRAYAWVLCAAVVLSALLVACGSGDQPLDQVDPAAVTANPTYEQVFAIIDRECVPCHQGGDSAELAGSAATGRIGDDTDLSTCASIVGERESIWDTIADNTMPPGALPRLNSEKRLIIRRWIDNGAPAPCN